MINKERLVQEFCKLVSIDASSYEERKIADVLTGYLKELGFLVKEDNAGERYRGNAGNLYGYLQGDIEGEPLLFSAHMDTVEPGKNKKAIVHEDGRITSDGTTVLGADDISGLAAILEAVRSLREQGIPHRSVEVLFPIAEELYLKGSEIYDFKQIKAKEAYVLDLSGPVGTAALTAPTVVSITASFKGKASHAGFAPEQGIHAIAACANAITSIRQGRIDEGTTVNIGTIEGGLSRNIVPELCCVKGEVRSLNHENSLKETHKIEEAFKLAADSFGAKLEFETSFGCIAYEVKKEHPVVKRYQKVCDELSIPVTYINTFGGSDNNNFIRNGITGIVIACGMNDVHSTKEYTHVDELERCANIVFKLLTEQ